MKSFRFQIWLHALLIASPVLLLDRDAFAQSPAAIEAVVRKSKWIAKNSPVTAVVGRDLTTISTYAQAKASDQDCKINSLFIMKELLKQFKSVHHLRISFFDPNNHSKFRTVEVSEGDVSLVDGGKPVAEVLSQLVLTRGSVTEQTANAQTTGEPAIGADTFLKSATELFQTTKLQSVVSSDGDVTIALPAGAIVVHNPEPGKLIQCSNLIVQVNLYRQPSAGTTFDAVVRKSVANAISVYPGWHKLREQKQTFRSCPALYMESEFTPGKKMRGILIQGREHFYTLSVEGEAKSDRQMGILYGQIMASLNIRG